MRQWFGALGLVPLLLSDARPVTAQATASQASPPVRLRPAFARKLTSCKVPGVEEAVLCGQKDVFEDRAARVGRAISLNIVVLPATTDSVLPDPLVFLAGGGVVPATRYAGFLARELAALRRRRDIVLVDQRGTGASNPLMCDDQATTDSSNIPAVERYLHRIAACRDMLQERADLRFYTTSMAMDDLDEVRAWLGYQTVNLYGASYGTYAAQVYLQQHPTRVRRAVLHGVVPLDAPLELEIALSAQRSLNEVFRLCAEDSRCAAAFPELSREFALVLTRLDSTPVQASVAVPKSGETREVSIDGRAFREIVNGALASTAAMRDLPLMIHRAASGDFQLAARARGGGADDDGGPPLGVRLSILCSDEIPKVNLRRVAAATYGTFLGDSPVRLHIRTCDVWPHGALPTDFWQPVRSTVPVLLLSAELDPITPPAYAEHVRAFLTDGRHFVLPKRSHNDVDPCVMTVIEQFVTTGTVSASDVSCLSIAPALAFNLGSDERP